MQPLAATGFSDASVRLCAAAVPVNILTKVCRLTRCHRPGRLAHQWCGTLLPLPFAINSGLAVALNWMVVYVAEIMHKHFPIFHFAKRFTICIFRHVVSCTVMTGSRRPLCMHPNAITPEGWWQLTEQPLLAIQLCWDRRSHARFYVFSRCK